MDLWSVHVKYNNPLLLFARNSSLENPISFNCSKISPFSFYDLGRAIEIRISKRRCFSHGYSSYNKHNSFVIKATGKRNSDNSSSSSGNGDRSTPGDNGSRGNSSDGNKSNNNASQRPHHMTQDWREFRAALFAREQAEASDSSTHISEAEPDPLGLKWAHPIALPETGSVLIATEKLDGVRTFERTVVLLLSSGTRHPHEGPFGVVINRPLHKKIKHMKPNNLSLATTFADCSLHFGGPLEASMFLLRTAEKTKPPGLEEVIPGLSFGARNSLDEAMGLVKKGSLKPHDFRFFVGYAGWQLDQLREEIESNYWHVAACSTNLIFGGSSNSSEGLWEEILELMGGQYSELSRKPKQDL